MMPASKIVPGVIPDPDETLVYWVESDSGETPYRVDLTSYSGNGKCDCMDFATRKDGYLHRGAMPSARLECKHIRRAARFMRFEVTARVLEVKQERVAHVATFA